MTYPYFIKDYVLTATLNSGDVQISAGSDRAVIVRNVASRRTICVIDPFFEARNNEQAWFIRVQQQPARSIMNDFNRKVEDASARVSKTVAEAAERIEKEIPEFIKYLNDEVVPAVRQHSTKALRVASVKLTELADYMEQQKAARK